MNLRAEKETRDNGVITASGIINRRALGARRQEAPPHPGELERTHGRSRQYMPAVVFAFFLSFRLSFMFATRARF